MINIVYDSSLNMFTFMAAPNSKEENSLENISRLDELLEAVSGEFGIFAAAMSGSTEEAYLKVVEIMETALKDEKIDLGLDLMLKENEDKIFLNNESKEEAVRHMAYGFKKSLKEIEANADDDDINLFKILNEANEIDFIEAMTENFKEVMKEFYKVNVDDIFENDITDDDKSESENSEFEEDLF